MLEKPFKFYDEIVREEKGILLSLFAFIAAILVLEMFVFGGQVYDRKFFSLCDYTMIVISVE